MESNNQKASIEFNPSSISHLNETRKWTLFLSILGFIFIGLGVVLIPILIISSSINNSSIPGFATTIPLILMAIIYFFPIYYLLKFSNNSKKAIDNSDSQYLETSFKFLKLHYRFMGIFVIVILCLYMIIGIGFLITSALK